MGVSSLCTKKAGVLKKTAFLLVTGSLCGVDCQRLIEQSTFLNLVRICASIFELSLHPVLEIFFELRVLFGSLQRHTEKLKSPSRLTFFDNL
jgi:hypothetical protein